MELNNKPQGYAKRWWIPVLVVLGGIFVFGLGMITQSRLLALSPRANSLEAVLGLIDKYYVDSVDTKELETKVMPQLLKELDPHSVYLPAEINKLETEGLEGGFSGIGVQFITFTDTVTITRVVEGGSSERAGLQAGDRILKADTMQLYGDSLNQESIFKKLRGEEGSIVNLTVLRGADTLALPVVRGAVPVSTLDASYMIDNKWLLVRINKWGAYTHQEFLNTYIKHKEDSIKGIILDLRDNGGGYLHAATALASEFLPKDKLIVYTQGRAYPREEFVTERNGILQEMPLIVLVNENSASASEIFAGAMQDHDRAKVVGRRTFGKGLVQAPFALSDNSVIRLTIARYYTPSGRSIQRSYASGTDDYRKDIEERYLHGELFNVDSVATQDSTVYKTSLGRTVYAGGGIHPDIFVPLDSTGINSYYLRLMASGTMQRFAFDYADHNRELLSSFINVSSLKQYLEQQGMGLLFDYAYYAQRQGVPIRTTMLHRSSKHLLAQLHARIADLVWADPGAFFEVIMAENPDLIKAVELLKNDQWRPTK